MSPSRQIDSTENDLQCDEVLPTSPIPGQSQHSDRTDTRDMHKYARKSSELQLHARDRSSVYRRRKILRCLHSSHTGLPIRRGVSMPVERRENDYIRLNVDRENRAGNVTHYYYKKSRLGAQRRSFAITVDAHVDGSDDESNAVNETSSTDKRAV